MHGTTPPHLIDAGFVERTHVFTPRRAQVEDPEVVGERERTPEMTRDAGTEDDVVLEDHQWLVAGRAQSPERHVRLSAGDLSEAAAPSRGGADAAWMIECQGPSVDGGYPD